MSENSKIEWTTHTCNFWWGCFKVSPGCTNCYAETLSKRYGKDIWGPASTTERQRTKGPWRDILKWNKAAADKDEPTYVFVQSMSDFFEDHPQVAEWREEAMEILESCENLTIQLLTKRPENIPSMAPHWMEAWPAHIWIGTSVENQKYARKRINWLEIIPAKVRFLSVEPLLGPVDLDEWIGDCLDCDALICIHRKLGTVNHYRDGDERPAFDWVIVGGESGHNKRPMDLAWARSLRDQCANAGVPFFFKQIDKIQPIPDDLMIREFPE